MSYSVLGNGIYTFPEAARLTQLRPGRVREWFRGRSSGHDRSPVFSGDYPPVDGDCAISFYDLVDVFVAGQMREYGVSLQTLRRAYRAMQDTFGAKHPFCRQELLTDGKDVFARALDVRGCEEIVEVLTRQKVFPRILLPFLKRIDYETATKLAARWRIADLIVVDPQMCFGQPIVEPAGIPTAILAAAYHANGRRADLVADWYDVHPNHVLAAAKFEGRIAA
jgi:uncharacterized protein (DUF433 family)